MAETSLDVEKILLAIEELRRWEERARSLEASQDIRPSAEETARVRQQISYYSGLLQDMKRRAHPDNVPRFMSQVGRRP